MCHNVTGAEGDVLEIVEKCCNNEHTEVCLQCILYKKNLKKRFKIDLGTWRGKLRDILIYLLILKYLAPITYRKDIYNIFRTFKRILR